MIESELQTALVALCPRVFPDVAPLATARPYVTFQGVGGRPLRSLDKVAADIRHTVMQINVWSATRSEANTLMRTIEGALCTSAVFNATSEGEPLSVYEQDRSLYGAIQRFSIYSTR